MRGSDTIKTLVTLICILFTILCISVIFKTKKDKEIYFPNVVSTIKLDNLSLQVYHVEVEGCSYLLTIDKKGNFSLTHSGQCTSKIHFITLASDPLIK